jgi:hypothetical protein
MSIPIFLDAKEKPQTKADCAYVCATRFAFPLRPRRAALRYGCFGVVVV